MQGNKKSLPKARPKIDPFLCKISNDSICHILSSRVESSEQVGFDSYGSSSIVDKSENDHIFSEEYMFTDKI